MNYNIRVDTNSRGFTAFVLNSVMIGLINVYRVISDMYLVCNVHAWFVGATVIASKTKQRDKKSVCNMSLISSGSCIVLYCLYLSS